ncbi:MAG: hypothetical protein ACTSXP_13300 [Promethearchaeota archaeon]
MDYIISTILNRNYTWLGIGREPSGYGERDAIFYDQDRFFLIDRGTLWFSEMSDAPSTVFKENNITRRK